MSTYGGDRGGRSYKRWPPRTLALVCWGSFFSSLLRTASTQRYSQNGPRTISVACLASSESKIRDQFYSGNRPQNRLVIGPTVWHVHPHLVLFNSDIYINHFPSMIVISGFCPRLEYYTCMLYLRWSQQQALPSMFTIPSLTEPQHCQDGYRLAAILILPLNLFFLAIICYLRPLFYQN